MKIHQISSREVHKGGTRDKIDFSFTGDSFGLLYCDWWEVLGHPKYGLVAQRLPVDINAEEREARKEQSKKSLLLVGVLHPPYNIFPTTEQVADKVIEEASEYLKIPFQCVEGTETQALPAPLGNT